MPPQIGESAVNQMTLGWGQEGLDDENDVYYVVLIAGDVVENRVLGDESQHRL